MAICNQGKCACGKVIEFRTKPNGRVYPIHVK
jgi:hypothetical protein